MFVFLHLLARPTATASAPSPASLLPTFCALDGMRIQRSRFLIAAGFPSSPPSQGPDASSVASSPTGLGAGAGGRG